MLVLMMLMYPTLLSLVFVARLDTFALLIPTPPSWGHLCRPTPMPGSFTVPPTSGRRRVPVLWFAQDLPSPPLLSSTSF